MPRPTHLLLMRHAEPEHHVRGLTGGFTDLPLTERGRREAALLAKAVAALAPRSPCRLLCSDLRRARETAAAVEQSVDLVAEPDTALRELDNGVAADCTLEEARILERPQTSPVLDWVPYAEGESWRRMARRVIRYLNERAAGTEDETWLVVSHGNAMAAVLHWWLGLGEEHWDRVSYDFDRASLTHLRTNDWGERVIQRLNDTAHLPEAP